MAQSDIATVLQWIAILEFFAAPIAGFIIGTQGNAAFGVLIFASGIVSGISLLGFARVINYLHNIVQRVQTIEFLLKKGR